MYSILLILIAMTKLVKVFKSLTDNNLLRILKMLQHKKMCACELSAALALTHLSVAKQLNRDELCGA